MSLFSTFLNLVAQPLKRLIGEAAPLYAATLEGRVTFQASDT